MISAGLTSGPVYRAARGWSTYSGRGIPGGTGRRGLIAPGVRVPGGAVEAVDMTGSLGGWALGTVRGMDDRDGSTIPRYWYNTVTGQVEEDAGRSKVKDLLGPYATREEAERALEKVKERNEAWERDGDDDWS